MSNETETQDLHGNIADVTMQEIIRNVIPCPGCGVVTLAGGYGGLCADCHANTRKRSERERKLGKRGHRMNRGVRNKSERGVSAEGDR